MNKMTSKEIRKIWIDFWEEKNHEIIESASLIPKDDDTLLWINAGIAPLKKYFDGSVIPQNKRMANIQKCLRTNDIENVGVTSHHNTFFEMLGNFSIGDYFKKDAIAWGYELIFEKYKFKKENIYITVYDRDEETYEIWEKLGIDESHLIRHSGNYWEIGPGPCGPDTEIFYDRGSKYDKRGIELIEKDIDNNRYIEIWNIVFSQYNSVEGLERDDYPELPHKNIDTGAGFERLVAIINGKESNYETDLFMPIINEIERMANKKFNDDIAFKAIADHIRTLVITISDGASFSNVGRGYVLRRLLRRAVIFGKELGIEDTFMSNLVDIVIQTMGESYPKLIGNKEYIEDSILNEEKLFGKTLVAGEKRINELLKKGVITGKDAFKMYDTYGFPFELVKKYADDNDIEIDENEFKKYMNEQKDRARGARKHNTSMNKQNDALLNYKEDSLFVGYNITKMEAEVIGLFDGDKFVDSIDKEGYVILDETPFYAESGGQVSDSGTISNFDIIDVVKAPNGQHMHFIKGKLNKGDKVKCKVDMIKRRKIRINHSSAHLVQLVLKKLFDEGITQAGSKIDEYRMRFDFNYRGELYDKDIIKIEEELNKMINIDSEVITSVMNIEDAKKTGATALFDEKYDDIVRVVKIGESIELCGGTHISNVSEIKSVAVISVESKGSNVYRIECATNEMIEIELFKTIKPYNDEMIKLLEKAKKVLIEAKENEINLDFKYAINNDAPKSYKDIIFNKNEMNNLQKTVKVLEKKLQVLKEEKALNNLSEIEKEIVSKQDKSYLIVKTEGYDGNTVKQMVDRLFNKMGTGMVLIANVNGSNVNFIGKNNIENINIGAIVKKCATTSGGNGGGSNVFAQGGGTNAQVVDSLFMEIKKDLLK